MIYARSTKLIRLKTQSDGHDLDALTHKELQALAKSLSLSAGGSSDAIKARIQAAQ